MLGAWLGVVSRAVVGAALEGKKEAGEGMEVGDWNIVQNNGPCCLSTRHPFQHSHSKTACADPTADDRAGIRAAQVVPHVHFHIIPRPGDVPVIENRSWTIFGKGQREDLDEEDAVGLVGRMREWLGREVERVREREGKAGWRALGLEERGKGVGVGVDGWGRRVRGKL